MASPDVRDAITVRYEERISELANRLATGDMSLMDWQIDMRAELRDAFALQLRAGNGGPITDTNEYLKLGTALKSQYRYLEQFGRDIRDGSQKDGGIANRAKMYARSSRTMYFKQAYKDFDLPAQPGEGSECLSNCKCSWSDPVATPDGVDVYWLRHADDSCPTCIQREKDWSPYHAV